MSKKLGAPKPRSGLIAALDLGTSKVACLIARLNPNAIGPAGRVQVVGIGHHRSDGMRAGAVVDLDAAEGVIRRTVETAESMVGENIETVFVNLSAGKPKSKLIAHDIDVEGREIGDADMARLMDAHVLAGEIPEGHEILHALPVGYSVDDDKGIRDPRGLYGSRLGVNLHMITAQAAPRKNLETVIKRCHLKVERMIATPYASALACLAGDEQELGATCIDIGGGTTSLAIYFDGELVHTDVIPIGGQHMTNDIARGLSTPPEQAERMKTLEGSVIPSPSDDHDLISVPLIGESAIQETAQVPRSVLIGIIRPRAEEILELVKQRLADSGFDRVIGQRVALTGGGGGLAGMTELTSGILGRQVRIATPRPLPGLPETLANPCFSTCAGLIRYAAETPMDAIPVPVHGETRPPGPLGRIGQWLRENF